MYDCFNLVTHPKTGALSRSQSLIQKLELFQSRSDPWRTGAPFTVVRIRGESPRYVPGLHASLNGRRGSFLEKLFRQKNFPQVLLKAFVCVRISLMWLAFQSKKIPNRREP